MLFDLLGKVCAFHQQECLYNDCNLRLRVLQIVSFCVFLVVAQYSSSFGGQYGLNVGAKHWQGKLLDYKQ
jgi:hypothetical protein